MCCPPTPTPPPPGHTSFQNSLQKTILSPLHHPICCTLCLTRLGPPPQSNGDSFISWRRYRLVHTPPLLALCLPLATTLYRIFHVPHVHLAPGNVYARVLPFLPVAAAQALARGGQNLCHKCAPAKETVGWGAHLGGGKPGLLAVATRCRSWDRGAGGRVRGQPSFKREQTHPVSVTNTV